MNERQLESKAVRYAEKLGFHAVKFKDPGRRGAPDRLFLGPRGRALFVEFKAPGEKPRPDQVVYMARLTRRGFIGAYCDSWASTKAFFDLYGI